MSVLFHFSLHDILPNSLNIKGKLILLPLPHSHDIPFPSSQLDILAQQTINQQKIHPPPTRGGDQELYTPSLAQAPHERTIHPHQFLLLHNIGFIKNNPNFILVASQCLDTASKLVGYVQLVRVEE